MQCQKLRLPLNGSVTGLARANHKGTARNFLQGALSTLL